MDIKIIATGSTGNCYQISNGKTTLLIECGIPFKKIQQALNFKLSSIDGCLISHEHGDHSKAVKDMLKAGIDCYMTRGTAAALGVNGHRVKTFDTWDDGERTYKVSIVDSFYILPFKTIHDAAEPTGFIVLDGTTEESLIFITDTMYCPHKFNNFNYLMIECNYIKSVLDSNNIHVSLRNRIVKNHMSLETCLEFLKANDLSALKQIYVMHLSDANSDEEYIKSEIQKATGKPTIIC